MGGIYPSLGLVFSFSQWWAVKHFDVNEAVKRKGLGSSRADSPVFLQISSLGTTCLVTVLVVSCSPLRTEVRWLPPQLRCAHHSFPCFGTNPLIRPPRLHCEILGGLVTICTLRMGSLEHAEFCMCR